MLRRIEIVQNIILTTILILYLVYLLALFLSATFVSQERFWAGLYGLIAGQLFWWLMIICAVVNLAIYFYLRDYKDFLIETGGYWEGERIIKSSQRKTSSKLKTAQKVGKTMMLVNMIGGAIMLLIVLGFLVWLSMQT